MLTNPQRDSKYYTLRQPVAAASTAAQKFIQSQRVIHQHSHFTCMVRNVIDSIYVIYKSLYI